MCIRDRHGVPRICSNIVHHFSEGDNTKRNTDRDAVFASHFPAGTSTRLLMHFQQMVNAKDYVLQKFDYGSTKNLEVYKQALPPIYNVSGIKKKVYLLVGKKDPLANTLDAKVLSKVLPNAVYREYDIGHISFMWGIDLTYFEDVLKILNGQEI
eukprot:TRINITY_DN2067_c0_g1_i1.p1 TRINITY_DN2067_c0_g1~~TRINITY_DN2067_c0_g1_i1.p1  ORF type:complete len:174 (-),score=42.62 TRINITY_DN2067_c0_g1_i1:76-537(-)